MTQEEAHEAQIERNKYVMKRRALIHKQVTPELIDALKERFQYHLPVFQKGVDGKLDTLNAACRDGSHEVIKWLEYELTQKLSTPNT